MTKRSLGVAERHPMGVKASVKVGPFRPSLAKRKILHNKLHKLDKKIHKLRYKLRMMFYLPFNITQKLYERIDKLDQQRKETRNKLKYPCKP